MYLANPKKYMDPSTNKSIDIIGRLGRPPAENAGTHTSRHNETEDDAKFAAVFKDFYNNTDFSDFKDGGESKL